MRHKLLFSIVLTSIAFCSFINAFERDIENNPPEVRITTPLNYSRFQWNAMVSYTISVSDKEDGTTEYNEIPTGEVLLKVVYLQDSLRIKKFLAGTANNGEEPAGLTLIKTSACFT